MPPSPLFHTARRAHTDRARDYLDQPSTTTMAKRPPAPAPSTEQTRTVCGLCAVFLPFLRQAGAAAWGLQYKSYVAASWKACSAGVVRADQVLPEPCKARLVLLLGSSVRSRPDRSELPRKQGRKLKAKGRPGPTFRAGCCSFRLKGRRAEQGDEFARFIAQTAGECLLRCA
jgi:hypothetical protein